MRINATKRLEVIVTEPGRLYEHVTVPKLRSSRRRFPTASPESLSPVIILAITPSRSATRFLLGRPASRSSRKPQSKSRTDH